MNINSIIHQLDILKEKYRERSVSLLVGAGFSKNACESFPSWTELLYDMAEEMYSTTISRDYDLYRQSHPTYRGSLKSFKKKAIPSLIANVGYLPMVSEYVKRKGFREAIEYYIEERIPFIDEKSDTFKFTGKNAGISYPIIKKNFITHDKVFEGAWEQIYTTNYDHLLEYAYKKSGRAGYDDLVIKDAPQLSMGRGTRTIIKLHGDLQNPNAPRKFIFDGNPHQQYIISEEDYQNYPKQHEAFTQLMRISLLQGVFCLVGFSGDDPNFQAWLSWVRDILSRGVEKKAYKIFLVDKSSQMAPPDKELFYENHNICYIPLENPLVKRHIGSTASDFRALLWDFFDFLYRGSHIGMSVPNASTPPAPSYTSLWSRLDPVLSNDEDKEEMAEKIFKEKEVNRIVFPGYYEEEFLAKAARQQSLTPTDASLAIIALQDTGLLLSSFDRLSDLLEQALPGQLHGALLEIRERDAILSATRMDSVMELKIYFENLLKTLFSLDFKKVLSLLNAWDATGSDVIKKAYYLSFFNVDATKQLLSEFLEHSMDARECFLATRLLNVFEDSYTPVYPITYYTSLGVTDYIKVGDNLFRSLTEKKQEIQPHGTGVNTKIIHMDGGPAEVDYQKAMAILNYLIEAPLGLSFRNFYTLRNAADWYMVHSLIFERHPFAALFFSIQCTDKKVRTRIGQDYAYSDKLVSTCLPEILERLMLAQLSPDTPAFLKPAILGVAKEILIAVNPKSWENLFMRIWKENVITNLSNLKDPRFPELKSFTYQALDCMNSKPLRQEIILNVLRFDADEDEFAINCLYYIRHGGLKKDEKLTKALHGFILNISKPWQIAVVGNLFSLLSSDDRKMMRQRILWLLEKESFDDVSFKSAQAFIAPDDSELQSKMINAICRSPFLWKTGVHEDGHYSSVNAQFLSVTSYNELIFPEEAIISIYEKLRESVSTIISSKVFDSQFYYIMSLEDVLLEMLTFLHQNWKKLKSQKDYDDVMAKVESIYNRTVDNHSLEDGLLSIYAEELVVALDFIEKNREEFEHGRLVKLIDLILNRILLMNSDGLDRCIRTIRYLLHDGLLTVNDTVEMNLIVMILDRTTPEKLNECNLNLAHATNNLSAIAALMEKRRFESKGITYWKTFVNNKRYYTNFI